MSKKRLHVISNTHWDREHREVFQANRYWLVDAFDKLIEIMENDPEYRNFTFDGQTIVVDDYLEVKPHMKERLKALIESGRILVGPWYSLPDHFASNPECIIRNLLKGDRMCRQFGKKMAFGYSIFSFGQMAQLPQLYAGFGVDTLILYKRYPADIITKSEFLWQAPDGTTVLASRLGPGNRLDFLVHFTIPVILGGDMRQPGWNVTFTEGTLLTNVIGDIFSRQYPIELAPDYRVRKDKVRQGIEDALGPLQQDSVAKTVFATFDGIDCSAPAGEIPEGIRLANEIMGDEVEVIHSNLIDYFQEFRKEVDVASLITYSGDMTAGPVGNIQSETMSANVELKQCNHKAEITILHYAEPFSAFNAISGGRYPSSMLQLAWKYLLTVQAHDAIHACGIAGIKADNMHGVVQAQEIAQCVARRALDGLVAKIDPSAFADDDILLTVFNPTRFARTEVFPIDIDLPRAEAVIDYHVETLDGERLEHYEYDNTAVNMGSINPENRPKTVYCDRSHADLLVKDIPPFGYKTFRLKRKRGRVSRHSYRPAFANPILPYDPIGRSPNVLDNGLLRVEINPNGTLDVTDLDTSTTTRGLNLFGDTACSGDMWIHRVPPDNQILSSLGAAASVSLTRNSYLSGTFKIDVVLDIPESLTADRRSRSCRTVPTRISTEVTLSKGARRVDFKVRVNNQSRDHKLTVCFPTGICTDQVRWEAPFQVWQHSVENKSNENGKIGRELQRRRMHGFLDVSDKKRGLALLTKGLKEFETKYYDGDHVLCELTLLRAMDETIAIHEDVFVEPTANVSQCIGEHLFEYALFFHAKDCLQGRVLAESRKYPAPLVAAQYGKGKHGELPPEVSFVQLSSWDAMINCIKKAEDSDDVIIRLTNPTDSAIHETLKFFTPLQRAATANMNEEKGQDIPIAKDNTLELDIPPYKIVTLCLTF